MSLLRTQFPPSQCRVDGNSKIQIQKFRKIIQMLFGSAFHSIIIRLKKEFRWIFLPFVHKYCVIGKEVICMTILPFTISEFCHLRCDAMQFLFAAFFHLKFNWKIRFHLSKAFYFFLSLFFTWNGNGNGIIYQKCKNKRMWNMPIVLISTWTWTWTMPFAFFFRKYHFKINNRSKEWKWWWWNMEYGIQ